MHIYSIRFPKKKIDAEENGKKIRSNLYNIYTYMLTIRTSYAMLITK